MGSASTEKAALVPARWTASEFLHVGAGAVAMLLAVWVLDALKLLS